MAANGIEPELQKSPPNPAEIARALLEAGAEADAAAATYRGGPNQTTMNLGAPDGRGVAGAPVACYRVRCTDL